MLCAFAPAAYGQKGSFNFELRQNWPRFAPMPVFPGQGRYWEWFYPNLSPLVGYQLADHFALTAEFIYDRKLEMENYNKTENPFQASRFADYVDSRMWYVIANGEYRFKVSDKFEVIPSAGLVWRQRKFIYVWTSGVEGWDYPGPVTREIGLKYGVNFRYPVLSSKNRTFWAGMHAAYYDFSKIDAWTYGIAFGMKLEKMEMKD